MAARDTELLLVSGNILKGGGSRRSPNMPMDEEVILSLDDTLRRCLQHSYYTSNQLLESPLAANLQSPTESPILTPSECCSKGITVEQRGDDDGGVERYVAVDPKYLEPFCGLDELDFKDTNVTKPSSDSIDDIISLLHRHLCVVRIDNFLISLADIEGVEEMDSRESLYAPASSSSPNLALIATWKTLEGYVDRGLISRIGVCDFTAAQLEKFIATVRIRPASNQIAYDFKNCCSGPQHDLLSYCKQNNIELLTHQDRPFIPGKLFRALMRKYKILSTAPSKPASPTTGVAIVTEAAAVSMDKCAPTMNDYPLPSFQSSVSPRWFLRYTSSLKSRGVATNRGYILLAGER